MKENNKNIIGFYDVANLFRGGILTLCKEHVGDGYKT